MQRIIVSQASLPVLSRGKTSPFRFPINRIFCVGRNYREHALEMGGDPDREPPFFFMKPADAICDTSSTDTSHCGTLDRHTHVVVPYPPMTSLLHFEGELVVAIETGGLRIPENEAMDHVFGYAVGCDLTRRDLQAEAKEKRRPWDVAKSFDSSAPCGPIVPKDEIELDGSTLLALELNGSLQQQASLNKMIWNIPETVSYLSSLFRLKPGDLIFTGTPSGVGELNDGDMIQVSCGDIPTCQFYIGHPEK
uniref:Fumarylacetoacetase-like C-terminal domain-containing protein n=2 Tax=Odontella aurita TaxID=265563 RepID=A0A7S4JPV5_9STRA|mmetsp:Transcript_5144/g.14808  ORF Transcript_5144/g.14808 Transcript_5144/m.14808 type:complete len:250 (+) Transcript_5144:188-937(+)